MKARNLDRTRIFFRGASRRRLAGLVALLAFGAVARGEVTAVASQVADDYVRAKRADGSFEPELYAFGEGGLWSVSHDSTIDGLKFMDIARTIAGPLAGQNYLPGHDPKTTKLLIMVYWGATAGTADASSSAIYQNAAASQSTVPPPPPTQVTRNGMIVQNGSGGDISKSAQTIDEGQLQLLVAANRQRDHADMTNAMLLGYATVLAESKDLETTALRSRRADILDEIEDSRYFVVLMAYDFQLMWKEKKHKLLWETRFSIRERHHDFGKDLPAMALAASRYFGQDSHGLVRKPEREGHVEIGETRFLEFEPEKK